MTEHPVSTIRDDGRDCDCRCHLPAGSGVFTYGYQHPQHCTLCADRASADEHAVLTLTPKE